MRSRCREDGGATFHPEIPQTSEELMRLVACFFPVVFLLFLNIERAEACSVCRCGDDRFFLNGAQRINHGGLIIMGEYFSTSKTSALGHHEEGEEHVEGGISLGRLASMTSLQQEGEDVEMEAHDQQVYRALFLYGLTERITLLATLPYAVNKIEEGGVSETSSGLSDPELTVIADMVETEMGDFEMNATVGTRIPLGEGDQHNEHGDRLEQHLQAGTGAWGLAFGLQAAHPLLAIPLFYGIGYQFNGSNSNDFSYGDVFRLNVATQIPLGSTIRVLAEGNLRYAAKDKEGEEVDANSGGTVVYLSPGLRISLPAGLALRGQVQIPVVEDLFGVQDEDVNFQIGLSIEP
jgi:hypothetical protein